MDGEHDPADKDTLVDPTSARVLATTLAEPPKDSDLRGIDLTGGLMRTPSFEDRYRIERRIGEGGMGSVTLYRDVQVGRRIALKALHPQRRTEPEAAHRFVREARVQGQLEHPAVVPVYDLGVDPQGAPFFTMKRVRGVSLEEIVAGLRELPEQVQKAYSRRRLLTAFSNVCLAVDFAHQHGVLHRDLKPGNVMLGHFGEVYVLDWGLAKVMGTREELPSGEIDLPEELGTETLPGALLGTPGYMAPEQMRGEHDALGPQADVYALGALLFELLTWTELHARSSMAALTGSTLGGVDARPSARAPDRDVPPELDAIVVKATALEPSRRYQTARELHQAIEAFLDGERDEQRRREVAADHARAASESADRSLAPEATVDERRRAMRSVGRALAFDPSNALAMQTLVRLLTNPPKQLPPEVATELERAQREQVRWVGRIGGFAFLSLWLYLPLVLWIGVLDWLPVAITYASTTAASVVSFATARTRRPKAWTLLAVMALGNVAFASTGAFWSPLVLAPTLLTINAMSFALYLQPKHRSIATVTAVLAAAVLFVLGGAGLLPATLDFTGDGMLLRSTAIELDRTATLITHGAVAVGAIVVGTLVVSRVRDALLEAEGQLYLYAWHLREFVPEPARPDTDPTAARRLRGL